MSYFIDFFINNNILFKFDILFYQILNNAINFIIKFRKHIILQKYDFKNIFRKISINSYNYWLLFFEWNGQFFMNIFLFFDLRIASRIFNLFSEALYWVFEILHEWNVTHYLDDFLFIFPLYCGEENGLFIILALVCEVPVLYSFI